MPETDRDFIRLRTVQNVTVVNFTRDALIDEEIIQGTGRELYSVVEDDKIHKLILNFTHVRQLASAALGKLIGLNRNIAKTKGWLKLCCLNAGLMENFRISRLDQIFDIYETEEEAIADAG